MFITTDMYRILCLCFLYTLILTGCQKETVIYTVSFDTRGGKLIQEMAVEEGTAYDPPAPEREGYTFTGWYSSPDLNRPWKEDDIITEIQLSMLRGRSRQESLILSLIMKSRILLKEN